MKLLSFDKRMNVKKKYIFLFILLFVILTVIFDWHRPIKVEVGTYLAIDRGDNLKVVIKKMYKKGIIVPAFSFKLYYKFFPKKINAGDYYLKGRYSIAKFAELFSKGHKNGIKVTFPEGITFKKMAEILYAKKIINKKSQFMKFFKDKNFINSLGINAPTLEGYLYPDTYYFEKNTPPETIIKVLYLQLKKEIDKRNLMPLIKKSKYTFHEILTIASIVEWEAKKANERPIIAQVFLKRLKINMPLESCATVLYALGKHKKYLTYDDLKYKSPFNTYLVYGLPPTPINNPGIDSIEAVLMPAKTDYTYFVSKNDGSHYFSKTYKEHLRAVRKYQ